MSRGKKVFFVAIGVIAGFILSAWLGWVVLPLRTLEAAHPQVPRPLVIAHRGASHWAPEETRPAYELARDLGADYLEMDVHLTRDGVVVVMHDDTPERTTNAVQVFPGREKQDLSEFTLDELKQLDVGSWFNRKYPDRARKGYAGQKILTAAEVLDIAGAKGGKYPVYIETKSADHYPGIEEKLVAVLREKGWLGASHDGLPSVIFQSFYADSLVKLKELAPETPRVYLVQSDVVKKEGGWRATVARAAQIGTGIGPVGTLCWPWNVGPAHRHGLVVHAYTLNEIWQYRLMTWFGVDGCFTDRCDLLMGYYGKPSAKSAAAILDGLGY